MGSDMEIEVIRKAVKTQCKTLSVRRGRGTAYGWIEIRGSGKYGEFTEEEKKALDKLGLPHGANLATVSPENRRYYVEKFARMLNIEIPEDLKKEYRESDEYAEKLRKSFEERQKKYQSCKHEMVKVEGVVVFPEGELYKCVKCGYEEIKFNKIKP